MRNHIGKRTRALAFVVLAFCLIESCKQQDSSTDAGALAPLLLGGANDAQLLGALNNAGVTALSAPPAQDPALVALGRSLFFDKELSGDRNISCSTCHSPAGFTGDALSTSIGAGGTGENQLRVVSSGSMVARNAPPLFNLGAGNTRMFWDGRVSRDNTTGALTTPESTLNGINPARADVASQLTSALAAQAMFPVASDVEMRGAVGNEIRAAADNQAVWAALMARLVGTNNGTTGGMVAYRSMFSAAYPGVAYDDLNFGHAARAIAAFETASYAAIHSPLDEFLRGNPNALGADAKAGGLLFFGRAGCGGCHRGPLLSDANFHGIAAPQLGPGASGGDDQGRFLISGATNDNYHFRTPALRNVELTAPYTHAGAYTTLAAVIAHYNDTATGLRNYNGAGLRADYAATVDTNASHIQARLNARDPRVARPLGLNAAEQAQIEAFLKSLTDPSARNLSPDGN